MAALSQKQRKSLARKAAKARWGKDKEMPARSSKKASRVSRQPRNTFGEALVQAQQQLAEAQSKLTYHQIEYNRLRQEIPALMNIVRALQQSQQPAAPPQPQYLGPQISYYPQDPQPAAAPLPPNYGMDTVLSDEPLPVAGPPPSMTFVMPPAPPPTPPARPPVPSMTEMPKPPLPMRGGGGAIGKPIEEEDENRFLNEANTNTAAAGGEWR